MIGRIIILTFVLSLCAISAHCQTKRAFLVGISEYSSTPQSSDDIWSNIHGANDVELLSQTLKKQEFIIKKLINKAATAQQIRKEIVHFISTCHSGDIVYLHFSCHGQPVEDLNGDETDGWDEALVPINAQKVYQEKKYTGENHIIDDELNDYLRSLRTKVGTTGFVYVVIDACHAGSSYRGDEEKDSVIIRGTNRGFTSTGKQFVPRIDKRGKIRVDKSNSMANICILEACRSYQVNSEIKENGKYYGSLSFYVDKALKATKLGKDISWTEKVVSLMNKDARLVRQNIVIETSL
jgi:hypothetical protein